MTLLLTEGFGQGDNYTTWWNNGESRWWQSQGDGNCCYPDPSYGRHGSGLRYNTGGGQQAIRRGIPNTTTVIQGHAMLHNYGDNYQFRALFRFWQGGTMYLTVHFDHWNNKLLVYRQDGAIGSGTLLGQTASGVHSSDGAWHYWECKATIDSVNGAVQVRRDGVTLINLTGVNTQQGANAYVDTVECCTQSNYQNTYIDDIYVCDTNGTTNNDFLGDVTIETLHPSFNGTNSQMLGSDGNSVNNYQLINDWNDGTWTDATNTGDMDTYAYGDTGYSVPSTILGVVVTDRAYKTDTGARSIANVALYNGNTLQGSDHAFSGTGINWIIDVLETKPGGGAWTTAAINAAEFGVVARP